MRKFSYAFIIGISCLQFYIVYLGLVQETVYREWFIIAYSASLALGNVIISCTCMTIGVKYPLYGGAGCLLVITADIGTVYISVAYWRNEIRMAFEAFQVWAYELVTGFISLFEF